jgi:sugar lactone lactonase YvrE
VNADLTLTNQRKFLDKEDADGMALDAEGNVWITGFKTSHIERIRPDGTRLAPIQTLTGANTQVRFGGADMRDYYVNGIPGNAGETLKEGGALSGNNSFLFRGRSEIPGMKIPPAQFQLA